MPDQPMNMNDDEYLAVLEHDRMVPRKYDAWAEHRLDSGPDRARLIRVLQEFDASDDYHKDDPVVPGYYAALNRAISLLRGDIHKWTDPKEPA